MAEKWSTLHGWNQKECVDRYLENARRWPFFGCKLFQAQVWEKKPPYGCKVKAGFHLIAAIKRIPVLFLPVVAIQWMCCQKTSGRKSVEPVKFSVLSIAVVVGFKMKHLFLTFFRSVRNWTTTFNLCLSSSNNWVIPYSRNYKENGYKLSAQRFLGWFERISVT